MVGRIDQATGASGNFALTLIGLADAINANTDNLVRVAVTIQTVFGQAVESVTSLVADLGIQFDGTSALIIAGAGVAGLAVTALGSVVLSTLAAITAALLANPFALLIAGISAAVTAAYIFRDEIKQSVGVDVVEVFQTGANTIIGAMVGAVGAVRAVWDDFPAFMEEIGNRAWNAFISAFEGPAIQWTDPWGNTHDLLNLDLSVFKRPENEIGSRAIGAATTAYRDAQGVDYIQQWGAALGEAWENADGATQSLEELMAVLDGQGAGGGGALTETGGKLAAYQQLTKSLNEQISALHLEAQSFGMAEAEATRFRIATELLRAAQESKMAITPALVDQINGLANAYAEAEERARLLQQQQQLAAQINSQLAGSFSSMFTGLIDGSKYAVQAIGDLLKSLGQLLINQAFNSLFGAGTGGGIGGMIAGMFGGFRADGGPVQAGMSYIVGERGPELFTPGISGAITPNHALPAANSNIGAANSNQRGDIIINNTIVVPAGTTADVAPTIAREVSKELRRQLPDAISRYERNDLRRSG